MVVFSSVDGHIFVKREISSKILRENNLRKKIFGKKSKCHLKQALYALEYGFVFKSVDGFSVSNLCVVFFN